METTVTSAIIGASGAVLGAIAKTFAPELKLLLTGRITTNSDLVGDWNCTLVRDARHWREKRDQGYRQYF
jgi:hypothetical protein